MKTKLFSTAFTGIKKTMFWPSSGPSYLNPGGGGGRVTQIFLIIISLFILKLLTFVEIKKTRVENVGNKDMILRLYYTDTIT